MHTPPNGIEKLNDNAWFTFLARGSMTIATPLALVLWWSVQTIIDDRTKAINEAISGNGTRVAIVETRVNDHEKRITQNEFQIQQIGKTLDTAIPVAQSTAASLSRDEERLDAMAMAMADMRKAVQDVTAQVASLALAVADLRARMPFDHHTENSDVGVPGAMTTQIEPLAGIPKLP